MTGLDDLLDPAPGPHLPAACRGCGGSHPAATGLCGYCSGRAKRQAARVAAPARTGCRVKGPAAAGVCPPPGVAAACGVTPRTVYRAVERVHTRRQGMGLALTRKKGERLVIGTAVVEVAQLGDGRVKLVVTAPKGVAVHREEVLPADARVRKLYPRLFREGGGE